MTTVTNTLTSDAPEATERAVDAGGIDMRRKRRWAIWGVVALVVIGGVWFGLSRGGGPTVAATVADCTQSLESTTNPTSVTSLQPGVVGLGSVASIATFDTPTGEAWCFDGMGVGSGGITNAQMQSALSAPVAVVDGGLSSNVLMLVHLGKQTRSVVVMTASSRSSVVARKDGFEVLRIPMAKWPPRHLTSHNAVDLGRILGFNEDGRVTGSIDFTWCLGSINDTPGTSC
jgi:hypothetical protein